MASTGLTVRISSPDLTERLVGAELTSMFAMGWEGSSIEDGTLVLTWSDPRRDMARKQQCASGTDSARRHGRRQRTE